MRSYLHFMTVSLILSLSISAASQNYDYDFSSIAPFGLPNPKADDAIKDFAMMIGECDCKSTTRNPDQSWQEPIDMVWRWKYIMNGMAVQDETLKSDESHSGSIRQFLPDSSKWYVHYYNSARPSTTLPVWEGFKKTNGKIILYRDQKAPNGMEGWYRLTFSEMSVDGYQWVGEWVDKAESIAFPTWKIECKRNHTPIKLLSWLEGTWKIEGRKTYESWKLNEDGLTGSSFTLQDNVKDIKEHLKIYWSNGCIYYEAQVLDQNDGAKIPFRLTKSDNNEFVFTNEGHDFPNEINYAQLSENKIFVTVSGSTKQFSFNLLRQD